LMKAELDREGALLPRDSDGSGAAIIKVP
jgi:hypothetical protein